MSETGQRCPWCVSKAFTEGTTRTVTCNGCGFWWLGELSDDDEPITREWFESEYGKNRIFVKSLSIHCRPLGHIWLDDEMQDGLAFLDHIRTRRQLRDLLAALGYRRAG